MISASISREAKRRYILKLSEDVFFDSVVKPLLLLRGLKDASELCGKAEKNKARVFYQYDLLANLELIAVLAKKGSLNLSLKSEHAIGEIVNALQSLSETQFALSVSPRKRVTPTKIYLVTNGKINEAARKRLIEQSGGIGLHFLDAEDLVPWIDEAMPQLWLDIDANVSSYFAALEKQLIGGDGPFARQFLPSNSSESIAYFGEQAVSVHVRRVQDIDAPTKGTRKKNIEVTFPLHAIPSKPEKKVLLLGEGGSGKTMGLLQIVYREAKRGMEGASLALIPVLLKASDIARDQPKKLEIYISDRTKDFSIQNKPVFGLNDLHTGRVSLFVDALDEIGDTKLSQHVIAAVDEFATAYPKCLIVVSSRAYEFLSDIESLSAYSRLLVVPINWHDAERIVDLVKANKTVPDAKIKESVRQLAKVQGFDLTPLMVSVYAATATFEAKDIPPNVTELFKRFTEQMLGRWDELKGLRNLHRPLIKDFALCALAFSMHKDRKTKISKIEACEIIRAQLIETGNIEDVTSLLEETIGRSGLFRDYGDEIGFRHHMFQEFFAGRSILTSEFVANHVNDIWWRRSIVFYFGNSPKTAHELEKSLARVHELDAPERHSAYCTIGLALQACYLSAVSKKIELWKEVVIGLAILATEFTSENDPRDVSPIITRLAWLSMARDAIALSHVADHHAELRNWIAKSEQARELFNYFVFALFRIGRFDLVSNADAKKLCDDAASQILGVFETTEASSHRPIENYQMPEVARVAEVVAANIKPVFGRFLKELELQLEVHRLVEDEIVDRTSKNASD